MRIFFIPLIRVKYFFLLGALIILSIGVISPNCPRQTLSGIRTLTVMLDPGHGGVDGGTKDRSGNLEKDINLAVCLKMRDILCQSGLNVVLTRETDTDLAPYSPGKFGRHQRDLMTRIRKTRESGSYLLISIHCDWSRNSRKKGALVFYSRQSEESKALADNVQHELNRFHRQTAKAHPGNFLIFGQAGIAVILVEIGFLSNPEEAAQLQDGLYREQLALSVCRGILGHCRRHIK